MLRVKEIKRVTEYLKRTKNATFIDLQGGAQRDLFMLIALLLIHDNGKDRGATERYMPARKVAESSFFLL